MKKHIKIKKKYDLFYDKIKDYHARKLLIERDQKLKYNKVGGYSKEYYALIKARKDIKDKIKEIIDTALIFSEIIRMGEFSVGSRTAQNQQVRKIDVDPDLKNYELTGDSGSVRQEISDEAKEFVRDVFNEEIVERLLEAIFFHGYRQIIETKQSLQFKPPAIDDKHSNYLKNIAKRMAERSICESMSHLDPKYSQILSEDLKRAVEICNV